MGIHWQPSIYISLHHSLLDIYFTRKVQLSNISWRNLGFEAMPTNLTREELGQELQEFYPQVRYCCAWYKLTKETETNEAEEAEQWASKPDATNPAEAAGAYDARLRKEKEDGTQASRKKAAPESMEGAEAVPLAEQKCYMPVARVVSRVSFYERHAFIETVDPLQRIIGPYDTWYNSPAFVLSKMEPEERSTFVTNLLRFPASKDGDDEYLSIAFNLLKMFPADDRTSLTDFILDLLWMILKNRYVGEDLTWFASFPKEERYEIRECAHVIHGLPPWIDQYDTWLAVIDVPTGQRMAYMEQIILRSSEDIPEDEFDASVLETDSMQEAYQPRRENTMDDDWNIAIRKTIVKLLNLSPDHRRTLQPRDEDKRQQTEEQVQTDLENKRKREEGLESIKDWMTHYYRNGTPSQRSVLDRREGGDTVFYNAFQVLYGTSRAGDAGSSVQTNDTYAISADERIGIGDLAVLIWDAINQYQDPSLGSKQVEADKEQMRYSFFMGLASCIDEDTGKRACTTGQIGRLIRCLQGYIEGVEIDAYIPTPAQLVLADGLGFERNLVDNNQNRREPTPRELHWFYDRALQRAELLYGKGTDDYEEAAKQFREHIRLTYDYDVAQQTAEGEA
ncbi:hypothetical protein K461DRAFT_282658 [Myriangium duriaei CBS 260.36]|uniref:Uncharacterized protein n=1 Tax=Myriangium duriaei CBS 260.36 TaxID=1168546 RepID=A0A9P4IWW1_9PEZI|nr:hypothetical protein K461DRAFT_282658 [Myriangium duriaei CBS 260.36]